MHFSAKILIFAPVNTGRMIFMYLSSLGFQNVNYKFFKKKIFQTSFENFDKMHASKMSYVNLNIFVNSSEIKTLTFLDYPRT